MSSTIAPAIRFTAELHTIGQRTIIRLPQAASDQLPSRGQTMVKGTINDTPFQTALEPDGKGGHWFEITKELQQSLNVQAGDVAALAIESTKIWPEPTIPADMAAALDANPEVHDLWTRITPMARWEWIRWVGATNKLETRTRRIEAACSKMLAGERRPCCFNRNMCCVPDVSKNGVLLDPATAGA